MDAIESRFPAVLWLVAVLILGLAFWRSRDRYLARIGFIVPMLLLTYPVLGNINLWLLQEEVHLYPLTEPYGANWNALLGTLGLVLVVAPVFGETIVPTAARAIDHPRMNRITLWGSGLALVINAVNYAQAGGIPILRGDLEGQERFTIDLVLPQALVVSSAFLAVNLIALFDRKRWGSTGMHLLLAPMNLLMAAGIGSRHLVILPVLVAFLFVASTKRLRNRWLIVGMLSLPIISVEHQLLRGEDIYEVVAQQGGEYRDYLLLEDEFGFKDFQNGATILPVVTNAVPKQLFPLVGLDKAELSKYSAFLLSDIWGADVGIRTGIWGEFFINWGGSGVIVGIALFGIALAAMERALLRRRRDEPAMLFLSFIAAMALFSVIGSWGSIGDSLGTYGVLFYVLSRLRAESVAENLELASS